MLSKEELKQKNSNFWEGFKQYMRGIESSNGRRMNWLTYPTDVKDIYVRLEVDHKHCSLNFDIQPKDAGIRAIVWEQMTELKVVLENEMNFPTDWDERYFGITDRGTGRISWTLENVSYYNEKDIPVIYEFLKSRLISFDAFYQEYKDLLIALMN